MEYIYTVSQITTKLKTIVEDQFPLVWISGEISNFSIPRSGHYYFTLKDQNAQINAVMFRMQNNRLAFKPANGMQVTGFGRVTVYELRGLYQREHSILVGYLTTV